MSKHNRIRKRLHKLQLTRQQMNPDQPKRVLQNLKIGDTQVYQKFHGPRLKKAIEDASKLLALREMEAAERKQSERLSSPTVKNRRQAREHNEKMASKLLNVS